MNCRLSLLLRICVLVYIYNKNADKFPVENHNHGSNGIYHSFKQHKRKQHKRHTKAN